jgi:hypothetical protein
VIETYEEYLERERELREVVLKQISETDQRAKEYIESIEPLTREEWETVQEIIYKKVKKSV